MGNKYFILAGVGVLILVVGIIYRAYFLPEESKPVETGVIREITIIAKKNEWRFIPELIEVNRGDRIKMTVINEDDYDHGIAIDAFGITQRMPANSTVKVEFVATQAGDFPFYCSVPCGEGIVDGKKRTHFDMIGKLHVRSIISSTE
jgi:heme/copper-type cytochrome/quinol oxidase subunit 2